jgi:hypothetical protein
MLKTNVPIPTAHPIGGMPENYCKNRMTKVVPGLAETSRRMKRVLPNKYLERYRDRCHDF